MHLKSKCFSVVTPIKPSGFVPLELEMLYCVSADLLVLTSTSGFNIRQDKIKGFIFSLKHFPISMFLRRKGTTSSIIFKSGSVFYVGSHVSRCVPIVDVEYDKH